MHAEARSFVAATVRDLDPPSSVIEFGSLDINGGVRDLFGSATYVGLDRVPGRGVDVAGDCREYEPKTKVACVVCCEVLEHVDDPASFLAAAAEMLKRGGTVIVTAACDPREPHSARDGGPLRRREFYENVNPEELAGWLDAAGFTVRVIEVHDDRGDVYATGRKR